MAVDPPKRTAENDKKSSTRVWIVRMIIITLVISSFFSFVSEQVLSYANIIFTIIILSFFVIVGIFFDMIGIAITAASAKPFVAMASRKIKGAQQCLRLLRRADVVANFCNDVVGDICGILSGATAGTILIFLASSPLLSSYEKIISIALSSIIATITIGGKFLGKSFAMKNAQHIVHLVGRTLAFIGIKG